VTDEFGILLRAPGGGADYIREDEADQLALFGHGWILRVPVRPTVISTRCGPIALPIQQTARTRNPPTRPCLPLVR